MSALYLGPYRQTDINGQVSRFFLNTILSQHDPKSVISRPIYIAHDSGLLSNKIKFNSESNTILCEYDVLIQHMPVEHMQYMPYIAKYHYAFPIIDSLENLGLFEANLGILNYFDKIFVQSNKEKEILEKSINKNKIEIFAPQINIQEFEKIIKQKFKFANYDTTKKFYFIGNINKDESIIKKIIFSMYAATSDHAISPICVFFLDFDSKPDIASLDHEIQNIRKSFGLKEDYRKEIFIFKHFSETELIVAHASCDIYLSINDSQTYYLQELYASLCNNQIISLDNYYDTVMPYQNNQYNYSYGISKRYISTSKLVTTLQNYL